jgi:hypothetical protein
MASRNSAAATATDGSDAAADAPKSARTVKGQDAAITIGAVRVGLSEDEKRAAGIDGSADAGPHDDSPEANRSVAAGGSIDTYAGMPGSTHDNIVGESTPLVLGQAPQAPTYPMTGSKNAGEKFDPNVVNGMHRSPVVRGVDVEPGRGEAGQRTVGQTHAELKAEDAQADTVEGAATTS